MSSTVGETMSHLKAQEGTHGNPVVDMARDVAVPDLPGLLTGPLVWSGADFKDQDSYTLRLSIEDLKEIDAALEAFKSTTMVHTCFGFGGEAKSRGRFRPQRRRSFANQLSASKPGISAFKDFRDTSQGARLRRNQWPRRFAILCRGQRRPVSWPCRIRG